MEKKLLGVYDYTVVLTYLGMACAFAGILCSINEHFLAAIICLMMAGVCDMFDGAVAATKEDRTSMEKQFGIQIDSMCDLISFCALPAIFLYKYSGGNFLAAVVSCLYLLCGLIRLSFFNVQELERQQVEGGRRKRYIGVPVTTIAIILPLVYLMIEDLCAHCLPVYMVLFIVMGLGFISSIEVRKPQKLGKILIVVVGIIEAIEICMLLGMDIM